MALTKIILKIQNYQSIKFSELRNHLNDFQNHILEWLLILKQLKKRYK